MPGKSTGSVTLWIGGLKDGDDRAIAGLWVRYFPRAVALARVKLGQIPYLDAHADEEDAALSAFSNLCEGAARGCFPRLEDRNDLWQLLAVITVRKAVDQRKRQGRLKRGGGRVILGTDDPNANDGSRHGTLDRFVEGHPGPEQAAMLAEEYRRRLDGLGDDTLRRVAQLRLDGYGNDEIADALGCSRRTVARKLEMIRDTWRRDAS